MKTTSTKSIRALWDKTSTSYAFFNQDYFPARLKLDLLINYSKKNFRCLDIGIANGIFSIPLSSHVRSIDGIDISEKMLETCKDELENLLISNIHLHCQSAEELEFENESFDLIFSFATLAVVPNIHQAIFEIKRTLKPGGLAILDITGRNNLSQIHWGRYYRSIGHFGLNSFTLKEFRSLVRDNNFELLELHSIGFLDQWKYIRGIHKLKFLEKIVHKKNASPDLDYQISRLFPALANHWITVLKKN